MQNKFLIFLSVLLLSSTLLFSKTLVTVNGIQITDDIIPKGYEQLDDTKRAQLMEDLIKEELIHAYLLQQNISKTHEFTEAFNQQKSLAEQQYLQVSGKSLSAGQIRNIKGSVALIMYQKEQLQSTFISDAQTKNFYDMNQEKFNFPDSVEIANIIMKTGAEAEAILNQLKSSLNLDEDFIRVARENQQNGYMGWFGKGMAPDSIFNAAFQVNHKTLIPTVVNSEHGFHVLYLLNKKSAGKLSYAEAQGKIAMMLKQKQVLTTLKSQIDSLYSSANILY
ncbi:MAG: peptidyl-prolyl cis-trans isomerase [Sulfurovaceae bacterium]|nr:peptidyl-prolyl cis-trans isomerase [Sulfurovaceae bacterium]